MRTALTSRRGRLAPLLLAAAAASSLVIGAARGAMPVYVVINVDVAPDHAAEGRAVLVEEGRLSRDDAGFLSWKLLQRRDRDNHLTIVEAWSSDADFDRHVVTDHARSARQKLQPILASPFDERTFTAVD